MVPILGQFGKHLLRGFGILEETLFFEFLNPGQRSFCRCFSDNTSGEFFRLSPNAFMLFVPFSRQKVPHNLSHGGGL